MQQSDTSMQKFSLVIVEDDDDERFYMSEAFKASEGFEVIAEFANGDQLLDWLQTETRSIPQLILSDLNMPGKNGYDIVGEVRKSFPKISVFVTSTSTLPATQQKCIQLGASGFLPKPDVFVDYDQFATTLYNKIIQNPSPN